MSNIRTGSDMIVVTILIVAVVALAATVVHLFFARSISNLTIEILAAIIAVVLVVVSVAVTIHFQAKAETQQEFRVELFKHKVEGYEALLAKIAESDDDGTIHDADIEQIRNHARTITLYASKDLIKALALFIERLTHERKLYLEDQNGDACGTLRRVVQTMREDLHVVEDDDILEVVGALVNKLDLSKTDEQHAA